MFKSKPLLYKQTIAADELLFSDIKKFNSERNLFFSNIYNNTESEHHNDNCSLNIKTDRTISYKNGLLKKFKSLKDLYTSNNCDVNLETTLTKFDDFERNYLFSNGKKDLVKNIRKNFENNNKNADQLNTEYELENKKNNIFKYNTKRFSFNEKQQNNNEFSSRNAPERKSFYQTINYAQYRSSNETDVKNVKHTNNFINAQTKYNNNKLVFENKCHKNDTHQKELEQQHDDDKIKEKTSWKNGLVRKCSSSDLNLLKKELNNLIHLKWESIDKLSQIRTKV